MEPKNGTVLAAAALAIALAVGFGMASKEDPEPKDVKGLDAELAKGSIPPASVYKVERSDGGSVYAAKYASRDGGEAVVLYLDESPCAWKPDAKSECFRLDGGDPGIENTMQAGQWSGPSCVRKACVILAGEDERK